MAEYGKVKKKMWRDQKFRSLPKTGRDLWQYLITAPESNMWGFYWLDEGMIVIGMQVTLPIAKKSIAELVKAGFIEYDNINKVVFIPTWFDHNDIHNPKMLKKAASELSEVPKTPLLARVIPFAIRFAERFGIPFEEQYGIPIPSYTEAETEAITETEAEIIISEPSPRPKKIDPDLREPIESFNAHVLEYHDKLWQMGKDIKQDQSGGDNTLTWLKAQIAKMRIYCHGNVGKLQDRRKRSKGKRWDWGRFIANWLNNAVDAKPDKTWRPYDGYMTADEEQKYYANKQRSGPKTDFTQIGE